jgi:hypothetical protein
MEKKTTQLRRILQSGTSFPSMGLPELINQLVAQGHQS